MFCGTCGLGFLTEEDRAARVKELANAGYGDAEAYAPITDAEHKARVAKRILMAFNAFHGRGDVVDGPRGEMFEVGFGNGAIMDEFVRLKWRAMGVDQSNRAVTDAQARRLEVCTGHFDEPWHGDDATISWKQDHKHGAQSVMQVLKGSFDIVVGWDAFEHLYDLPQAFTLARLLLKSGGLLAIHSPSFPKYSHNPKHPHFNDRSHLWHMSPLTIPYLCGKAGLVEQKLEISACWGNPGYSHPDNFCLWAVKP